MYRRVHGASLHALRRRMPSPLLRPCALGERARFFGIGTWEISSPGSTMPSPFSSPVLQSSPAVQSSQHAQPKQPSINHCMRSSRHERVSGRVRHRGRKEAPFVATAFATRPRELARRTLRRAHPVHVDTAQSALDVASPHRCSVRNCEHVTPRCRLVSDAI